MHLFKELLLLFITIFSFVNIVNGVYPADCSMRPLCANFRTKTPNATEVYKISPVFSNSSSSIQFSLTNLLGNELKLKISAIDDDKFRVIIEEPESRKFHVEDSLVKKPNETKLSVTESTDQYVVVSNQAGSTVQIWFYSFQIQFNNISTFDGQRLFMENIENSQVFTFAVNFINAQRLIGLPEHAAGVSLLHTADLSRDPYRFKNTGHSSPGFNTTSPLYGTVPLIHALSKNSSSGIFLNNGAEMFIDINNDDKSAYFMVNRGVLDLFILVGPTIAKSVKQYTDLTGTAHLPQIWTLGYHQSRYSYKTAEEVKGIIENFDKYNIPLDSVWLDIDYTDGYRYFTWNHDRFPDPIQLLDWVESQSERKIIAISDPHIKTDSNYKVYAECSKNGYFIKNADGSDYINSCWPGQSSWIDYLNPEARDYYASLYSYDNFISTPTLRGIWNDMNEPTIFDENYEMGFPYDALLNGNVRNEDISNMYGFYQTMATHQGLMQRDNGKYRPFVLTRSAFAGSQRYSAKWAGDTGGGFLYQRSIVPMTISYNLAGLVFYGGDVPGFLGDPTEELATRWYQIGAWIPFYRGHGREQTKPREPWTFSNKTCDLIREAIVMRYLHLPYWYSLFYEHTISGSPLIRPLFYVYPLEEGTYDIDDEFLLGTDILVANVYNESMDKVNIYLPGATEQWFLITGNSRKIQSGGVWIDIPVDISFIPVFYRGGSIIARKVNAGRSTAEIMKNGTYELHIILNKDGTPASTNVYLDDYESFAYLENNDYAYFNLIYTPKDRILVMMPMQEGIKLEDTAFTFNVVVMLIYTDKGDGTYEIRRLSEDKFGVPFGNRNLFKDRILTL